MPNPRNTAEKQVKCLHCKPGTGYISGTNLSRMKDHLLNTKVCNFPRSSAAAEIPDAEVQDALRKQALDSSQTRFHSRQSNMFEVRRGSMH